MIFSFSSQVLEGKQQLVELSGNLISVTKSGDQLRLGFHAFQENRLPFTVRLKDSHSDPIGRMLFFKEQKVRNYVIGKEVGVFRGFFEHFLICRKKCRFPNELNFLPEQALLLVTHSLRVNIKQSQSERSNNFNGFMAQKMTSPGHVRKTLNIDKMN